MQMEVIVLRLIHILGGVFWVGGLLFQSIFLMPALANVGPAAGAVMAGLMQRKLPVVMPVLAILTLLSGLRLLMIASANFQGAYFSSPVGRTFSIAGGLAIVAFILGMATVRPAMMKAAALGQQMAGAPDDATRSRLAAEMAATRQKGIVGNLIVMVLLLLAASGMAVARYVG
jgi:uncharacterized membrane protein